MALPEGQFSGTIELATEQRNHIYLVEGARRSRSCFRNSCLSLDAMSPSYSSTMHLLPGPLSGSLWRLSCRSHSLYSGHPVTNFMRLAAICTKRSFTLSLFAASDRRHDYLSRVHDDPLTDLLGATSHNIKGVDSCRFASLTLYHIFLYPLHILFVDEIMLDALKISTFLVALSSTRLALAQDL